MGIFPYFYMSYVILNGNKLDVIVAVTDQDKSNGLMNRDNPCNMLFFYREPMVKKFWMKNVKFPLDIIFCLKGSVVGIESGEPLSTKSIGPDEVSDIVLELPLGDADKYKVKPGDKINFIPDIKTISSILAFSKTCI
jgi:uncharacterized membrane protein (UPF0127 family)